MADDLARLLDGDRGERKLQVHGFQGWTRLHGLIARYQAEHPDTLMSVHYALDKHTMIGTVTVKWWPRGTEKP